MDEQSRIAPQKPNRRSPRVGFLGERGFRSGHVDEAEAAYYRRQADQGNAGEPSYMNEEEENAFLSQAADEAEATYYRR